MKFVIVLWLAATVTAVAETKKVDDAHTPQYAVVDKIPLPDGGWDYSPGHASPWPVRSF